MALRIPKAFALDLGLANESPVEITVKDHELLVEPVAKPGLAFSRFLAGVTKANRQAEIAVGPTAGNEAG